MKMTDIKEKWFVNDDDWGFEVYDTEKEAEDMYKKLLKDSKDESRFDGWSDYINQLMWGKVYQTTELMDVPNPQYRDDSDEGDPSMYLDAVTIEHRIDK
jgi:hypothetical protein